MRHLLPYARPYAVEELVAQYKKEVLNEQPRGNWFQCTAKRFSNWDIANFKEQVANNHLKAIYGSLQSYDISHQVAQAMFLAILAEVSTIKKRCKTLYGPMIFHIQPDTPYAKVARMILKAVKLDDNNL